MAQAGPIAIYGASGYTGTLVVSELVRRGLDHVVSGRNEDKLRAVAERAGSDAPVLAAPVDDVRALRRVFEDCAAVINCAGPFTRHGEAVVRAAVESATHYVDTTGEQPYMKRIADRYDAAARSADVAVVTAMGFDYVPGDLICRLAAEGHEPVRELVVAYAVSGFGPTHGTMRSALEALKGGDFAYVDGDWRPAGAGPLRARFSFPAPIGSQPVGKYPSGEIVTVPRHTDVRTVTSLVTLTTFLPVARLAPLVPFVLPAMGLVLRTPLGGVLDSAIGALPEGPDEASRRAAEFTIVAVAHGEDGSTGSGVVRGSDVYGLTAVTAVHGAAHMAAEGYDRSGVLPPATAYDPVAFLNYLGDHGVSWERDAAPVSVPA
jgi:short subunit dehydrogenase-like uncharacterized protein